MTYRCIMACDPGVSGAIAFFYPEHPKLISVYDMPSIGKEVDGSAVADLIKQYCPDICIIESVSAMPKQGVTSSFNFGQSFGCLRGAVAASRVPTILVSPQKWKKAMSLDSDKEKSRRMAILFFPDSDAFRLKKSHGRAEAALMALYGAQTQR
jgi:crossover junction endodeoxyribonuclease RuvC